MKVPNHVAIIMDGNGRWGLKKHNSRLIGHEYGIKNIRSIVNYCKKKKIKNLTLYALSVDNINKRSQKEIKNLFSLLYNYLIKNIDTFIKNKIELNFIGEKRNLTQKVKKILIKCEDLTKNKKKIITINIAFNYSSKLEIINSFKKNIRDQNILNISNISKFLYTNQCPDPEILIRTGGHTRLSDFLLWQCSYSEIFFVKKLWPDFKPKDLSLILNKYKKLKRNFGS